VLRIKEYNMVALNKKKTEPLDLESLIIVYLYGLFLGIIDKTFKYIYIYTIFIYIKSL